MSQANLRAGDIVLRLDNITKRFGALLANDAVSLSHRREAMSDDHRRSPRQQFLHGRLPFGGVNNSGLGSAHGIYGFKAFSHERAVVKTWLLLASTFYPPYTHLSRRLINWTLRLV